MIGKCDKLTENRGPPETVLLREVQLFFPGSQFRTSTCLTPNPSKTLAPGSMSVNSRNKQNSPLCEAHLEILETPEPKNELFCWVSEGSLSIAPPGRQFSHPVDWGYY